MLVAGIDAGGSKTECIIFDRKENKILARVVTGPANYQVVGIDKACQEIKLAIDEAKKKADIKKIPLLGIGMAGVGRKKDRKRLKNKLSKLLEVENFYLNDDGYIALLGATGGEKGIVVIAGTGSIAYALKKSGEKIRSGGWGPLIGDEGSGFWIGIEAIKKAVRAEENRENNTLLVKLIKEHYSFNELQELIPFIYDNDLPRKKIARLAPGVFELAQKGDILSKQLVKKAVFELSLLVSSLRERLDYKENKIAVSGGLFNSDFFYDSFKKHLKEKHSLQIYKAEYSAAYGAVFYALQENRERSK